LPTIALAALGAGFSEKLLQQLTVYISGFFCGMKVQIFHVDIADAIEFGLKRDNSLGRVSIKYTQLRCSTPSVF
jgi:hypothetical protein